MNEWNILQFALAALATGAGGLCMWTFKEIVSLKSDVRALQARTEVEIEAGKCQIAALRDWLKGVDAKIDSRFDRLMAELRNGNGRGRNGRLGRDNPPQ